MERPHAPDLPAETWAAVSPERRGSLTTVEYPVHHYIDASRQFVAARPVDPAEAGRAVIHGEPILKSCNVYLPAEYRDRPDRRYNVLYLLHGVGGDAFEWLRSNGMADGHYILCNMLDRLIAEGVIDPLIAVFPNGRSAHDWTDVSFNFAGTNLLGFYYFDYELRHDLIPFIESTFRTIADISDSSAEGKARSRLHRAIAGLSMGGMQTLNLVLGGYRCDAAGDADAKRVQGTGLAPTVPAPGMTDLFAYAGAFSCAPTTSEGRILGASLAASEHKLHLLYMNCGDRDEISLHPCRKAIEGLADAAGDRLGDFRHSLVPGGVHDFGVWNRGAYDFVRLAFRSRKDS